MKNLIFIAISLSALVSMRLTAQEIPDNRNVWTGGQSGYIVTGDLSVLRNVKTFNIIITPGVKKMGASEVPDSVYVATRVQEWNAEKPGKGGYTRNLMEFMSLTYIILDIDVVKTEEPEVINAKVRCPVNNSSMASEHFTGDFERAHYGAGVLFGRYLKKTVYK